MKKMMNLIKNHSRCSCTCSCSSSPSVGTLQEKNIVGVTFLEEQHYKFVWHDSKNLSCADSTRKRPSMDPAMHAKHDRRNRLACCPSQTYTNNVFFLDRNRSAMLPKSMYSNTMCTCFLFYALQKCLGLEGGPETCHARFACAMMSVMNAVASQTFRGLRDAYSA